MFGLELPPAVGEGGQEIANAVGLTIIREDDPARTTEAAREHYDSFRSNFDSTMELGENLCVWKVAADGHNYAGQLEVAHYGTIIYVVMYTATPLTIEQNYERFNRWRDQLRFFQSLESGQ
jgi:hypothetical protein